MLAILLREQPRPHHQTKYVKTYTKVTNKNIELYIFIDNNLCCDLASMARLAVQSLHVQKDVGSIQCWVQINVYTVLTQEEIPEEGRLKKAYALIGFELHLNKLLLPHNIYSGTKHISLFSQRPFHFRVCLIIIKGKL